MLITVDFTAGAMRSTSRPMTEAEFRADLAKRGYSDSEISKKVEAAPNARIS